MADGLASLRGRIGAYALAAQHDPKVYTAAARAASPGSLSYWEARVDPESHLPPAERARRAEAARKEHFARLAMKSARARSRRKKNGRSGDGGAAETITGEETSDAEPNDTP